MNSLILKLKYFIETIRLLNSGNQERLWNFYTNLKGKKYKHFIGTFIVNNQKYYQVERLDSDKEYKKSLFKMMPHYWFYFHQYFILPQVFKIREIKKVFRIFNSTSVYKSLFQRSNPLCGSDDLIKRLVTFIYKIKILHFIAYLKNKQIKETIFPDYIWISIKEGE